jgi:hypothetical protein
LVTDYKQSEVAQRLRVINDGVWSIPDFLNPDQAFELKEVIGDSHLWGLTFCAGERVMGLPPEEYRLCNSSDVREMANIAYDTAKNGFSFLREELWLPPLETSSEFENPCVLSSYMRLVRSKEFSALLHSATGISNLELTRFSVQRYRRGHFLAFSARPPVDAQIGICLCLTNNWAADWGGVHQFRDIFGSIELGITPAFNALTIYSLSKPNAVSFVGPFTEESCLLMKAQFSNIVALKLKKGRLSDHF